MGRDVTCKVTVDGREAQVKALLESEAVVLRAPHRLTIPFSEMKSVSVTDGRLTMRTECELAILELEAEAERWLQAIRTPKSRLDKIGVKPEHTVSVLGPVEESWIEEIRTRTERVALGRAQVASDLIFFHISKRADLARIRTLIASLKRDGALWIIRPKGATSAVSESDSMKAGKEAGLVDVKVVSFSPTHSAEKFVIPVAKR